MEFWWRPDPVRTRHQHLRAVAQLLERQLFRLPAAAGDRRPPDARGAGRDDAGTVVGWWDHYLGYAPAGERDAECPVFPRRGGLVVIDRESPDHHSPERRRVTPARAELREGLLRGAVCHLALRLVLFRDVPRLLHLR